MGSAIWSADAGTICDFTIEFFLRVFRNHGLLSVKDRPQWRVIEGGSREYLAPLTHRFEENIRVDSQILEVQRKSGMVELRTAAGEWERFDQVVIATHSDQALALLADASPAEREILGALPYQANDVVLHTDTSLLPRNRRT